MMGAAGLAAAPMWSRGTRAAEQVWYSISLERMAMQVEIDMIGLTVRDMAASLRFYRMLHLAIPEGVDDEAYVEVITPNGYRISWNTVELVKQLNPDWQEPVGQRMTLAFKCSSVAEVDALFNELVAAGYESHREPWDAFWGQRYAGVIDPDGNVVDLFCPLEG